jgi:competence ComEA-like helix-hairpin-helix protein
VTIFTPQERRVVLFLLVSLLAGSAVKLYRSRRRARPNPTPAGIAEYLSVPDSTRLPHLDTLIREVGEVLEGNIRPIRKKVIDLNTASESDLCLLPGIGPSIAQRIVRYRESNGKFKSTKDLVNVSGIGEKKLRAIEEMVYAGGGTEERGDAKESHR